MKTSSLPCPRGFSMVELMVVVGIMVVLSGFLIAALPGIRTKIKRNQVEAFIAELERGLSSYQIDHGSYPLNEPSGGGDGMDQDGIEGAKVLYKHLSGDYDTDGKVDFEKNEKVYVPKLDYSSNRDVDDARSTNLGGDYMVVDPFGDPVRYVAQPPNIPPKDRKTRNPTYDLWSIAGNDPDVEGAEAGFIGNWKQ